MKRIARITLLLLVSTVVFSQQKPPSQAELEDMIKKIQKKADSVRNDPKLKKYTDENNGKQPPSSISDIVGTKTPRHKTDTAFLARISIPPRNNNAIGSIPAKVMTRDELIRFIRDMKSKIMTALYGSASYASLQPTAFTADVLTNSAVMCWYTGSAEKAIELALHGASNDPDNMNALSNLSAILNLCGFPYKAVPLLDYVNQKDPANSTVSNNLGQAYLQMGDASKASTYLKQAIAGYQHHPQANFMMACIEYARGNRSGAQSYCENSLRGAFSVDAWKMLKAIHPIAKLMELVRHRYKQPDVFNPHKFELPPQCEKPEDSERLKVEYAAYKKMLMAARGKYHRLVRSEDEYLAQHMTKDMMAKATSGKSVLRPFGAFGAALYVDISSTHQDDERRLFKYDSTYSVELKKMRQQYDEDKKRLDESFESRADKVGEGNPDLSLDREICDAQNNLARRYLPKFADINERRQQHWINVTKNYYNDIAFWNYVGSLDDHEYRRRFYQVAEEYIAMLQKVAVSEFGGCNRKYSDDIAIKLVEVEQKGCPFKATVNVNTKNESTNEKETPASFEIDCEQFAASLDLGQGVSFKSRTVPSGATTIAFEGGVSRKGKVVRILPVSVSGSMQTSLTFGGGQPLDIGIKWDYGLNLPDFLGGKNSAGWSVSLNNGVDFHGDGKLVNYVSSWSNKNIFGIQPDAPQINKNVKPYQN